MSDTINVSIRPMSLLDLDVVVEVEQLAALDPWSKSSFLSELEQPNRRWLVAVTGAESSVEHAKSVIGFGGVMVVDGDAHVMNIAVAPDHQRRGLGHLLLSRLLAAATDLGAKAATLEVRASNRSAISLYQRHAFESAGTRPAYYADDADAVIMWLYDLGQYSTSPNPETPESLI